MTRRRRRAGAGFGQHFTVYATGLSVSFLRARVFSMYASWYGCNHDCIKSFTARTLTHDGRMRPHLQSHYKPHAFAYSHEQAHTRHAHAYRYMHTNTCTYTQVHTQIPQRTTTHGTNTLCSHPPTQLHPPPHKEMHTPLFFCDIYRKFRILSQTKNGCDKYRKFSIIIEKYRNDACIFHTRCTCFSLVTSAFAIIFCHYRYFLNIIDIF